MKITWLGHSAFRVEFVDKVILIDPFFTNNPAFEGTVEQASQGVTHILVTHGHFDHVGDAAAIAKATGAKVVTNFDLCMHFAKEGVQNFDPMNTGGTTEQGGFTVTLVHADHSSGLGELGVNYPVGPANGVVIKAEREPVLYHMGDTEIFGDMALIAELHQPEIVIVPIGDRFTMGAQTAALALTRFFKARVAIPCHYASFPMVDQDADKFVAAMDGSGVQVVVPHKTVGVRI
jgi:L-ascorbate metabolism protein UlaG (beta-lactamase superfamily)